MVLYVGARDVARCRDLLMFFLFVIVQTLWQGHNLNTVFCVFCVFCVLFCLGRFFVNKKENRNKQ